ncbi:MAG: alcohol dehydrogenase catalytic domain-containing protein [Clostridia bacterium]|nr:alcohol dehydrogenase catalytic domain-containing protein [Clostridia bacterium]
MNKTVKSANLHAVNDLRYEDTCLADCQSDEVLVEVKSCGICGSDISRVYSKGTYHFPTIIGHEFSGKVVYDPKNELNGKKVVVFPLLPCFECESCKEGSYATCENYDYYGSRRDGGMTEYIQVKRWNVIVMPRNLSYDEGAMCEPVSVARHAVLKLGIKNGDNVFISGAGPIGLVAGMWAKMLGAKDIFYIV